MNHHIVVASSVISTAFQLDLMLFGHFFPFGAFFVDFMMSMTLVTSSESLGAMITLVGFLSSVDPNACTHVVGSSKKPVTMRAFESLFPVVPFAAILFLLLRLFTHGRVDLAVGAACV